MCPFTSRASPRAGAATAATRARGRQRVLLAPRQTLHHSGAPRLIPHPIVQPATDLFAAIFALPRAPSSRRSAERCGGLGSRPRCSLASCAGWRLRSNGSRRPHLRRPLLRRDHRTPLAAPRRRSRRVGWYERTRAREARRHQRWSGGAGAEPPPAIAVATVANNDDAIAA